MVIPSTSLPIRPLKRSTMPLVCGEYGLVWRYSAPSSAQTLAKAAVKQLPLSVSTWVRRKGKAAAASRRKAMALFSVSSSLTARWTEREQARIIRALVERVVVGPAGADIRLRVEGLAGLVRDLTAIAPEALRAAA